MKHLFLKDLKNRDEAAIKNHIAKDYSVDEGGFDNAQEKSMVTKTLKKYNVVIAYESVGDGTNASSYFLLRHTETGEYQEFSGLHCSCNGFEGQFELQKVTTKYLKSNKFFFCCDVDDSESEKAVNDFLAALTLEKEK